MESTPPNTSPTWNPFDTRRATLRGGLLTRRNAASASWQWLHSHSFTPSWLPPRWRQPIVGYVFSVLLQVLAALLTLALAVALPRFAYPGTLVLLVVVFVALNWGALTGLVAAVIGVALVDYLLFRPAYGSAVSSIEGLVALVLFVGVALVMSMLASSSGRSKRRALEERAEAQAHELTARRAQDELDEFMAIASHDLRSPLTVLIGYIELAKQSYNALISSVKDVTPELQAHSEKTHRNLDGAGEAAERLTRLIELLFDRARAQAGKLDFAFECCDLRDVVRDEVEDFRVSEPQRAVHLTEACDGQIQVMADPDAISQVLTNYLSNARKYSPEDQPIDVWVGVKSGRARVAVADHGPGLPASEQERIWQRFYRAAGVHAQRRSGGSLGLGLHICKRIAEGHGGTVGVDSEVGRGSTFWFELPLADDAARSCPLAHPAGAGKAADALAGGASSGASST